VRLLAQGVQVGADVSLEQLANEHIARVVQRAATESSRGQNLTAVENGPGEVANRRFL
jgi:hypothetical protein